MKKLLLGILLCCVAGCANSERNFATYLENPKYIIRDPNYDTYQGKRDAAESQYLSKEITYAEYIEKRDEIDAKYDRDAKDVKDVIVSNPNSWE